MKNYILFLILTFTTLNVYAKWVKVVTNEEADFYVKTDSIKRKGHMGTYWEMTNYKSTKTADGIPYLSLKMKSEVNCDTEEDRILFIAPYSENMGLGRSLEHIENFSKSFTTIVPDTIAHAIFKFVCGKK